MADKTFHLTVGADSWCQWTGCNAGQRIAERTGVWTCTAPTMASAKRRAAKLRPHFKRGSVAVVAGPCPNGPVDA